MIEILIALFMASIVIAVAFRFFVTQHNQMLVQEDVSEIQANARAAAQLLAEEIRKTGYRLPPIVSQMMATNSNPDTMVIRYARPILAGVELERAMIDQYDVLDCNGISLEGLEPGDWVFVYNEDSNIGEPFIATEIDFQTNCVAHDMAPLHIPYPEGSKIFAVESCSFYIDRADRAHPNLMMRRLGQPPEVFAENIEALDFVYYLEDGSSTTTLNNPALVRMVGINVTATSFRPNLNSQPGMERTRSYSLKVKLRNFGLS
jgi:hypothetical protein